MQKQLGSIIDLFMLVIIIVSYEILRNGEF